MRRIYITLLLFSLCTGSFCKNRCTIISVTDAIVIVEFEKTREAYRELGTFIVYNGKKMPFVDSAVFNTYISKKIYSFSGQFPLSECDYDAEGMVNAVKNDDYTLDLKHSRFNKRYLDLFKVKSVSFYQKERKKNKLYIVYKFTGDIVQYSIENKYVYRKSKSDMKKKDTEVFYRKKFAVLRKALKVDSLDNNTEKRMRLKKTDIQSISLMPDCG